MCRRSLNCYCNKMDEKEFITNPFTGRAIQVGGRTYKMVEADILLWLDSQCGAVLDPNRPKLYCGNSTVLPDGYSGRATPYQCLRKGFKSGLCKTYERIKHSSSI